MVNLFPELASVTDYLKNQDIQTDVMVMAWYESCLDLENRVLWRVELPGGRTAEYMVSVERLIGGDYTVVLDSQVVNWWAVAVTLLLLLAAIWLPLRRRTLR